MPKTSRKSSKQTTTRTTKKSTAKKPSKPKASRKSPASRIRAPIPESEEERRRHIRFPSEPGTHASIDVDAKSSVFRAQIAALVVQESHAGCSLVIVDTPKLQVGDYCRVSVGRIGVFASQVRWRETVSEDLIKLGIEYLSAL